MNEGQYYIKTIDLWQTTSKTDSHKSAPTGLYIMLSMP